MNNVIRKIDHFDKNIILVFVSTSLANLFNLLYQLFIAHRLVPSEFAAFNALLSIFMLISSPLITLQAAIAKYSSQYNAHNQTEKTSFLLSNFLKKAIFFAIITFLLFYFLAPFVIGKLKISSIYSGYILAAILGLAWITPVFLGTIQGLELFNWFNSALIAGSALKLILSILFILMGFGIAGALGALLVASLIGIAILVLPVKSLIVWRARKEEVDFREIYFFLFPIAISAFCYTCLVSMDMILVKYFFSPEDSGIYSLAQMVGKIFLFLPGAISIVMFPVISGLSARNLDTSSTLRRSLLYAAILCVAASLTYNLFPVFILKVLTGKAYPDSISLGRLFSISMVFFTLSFVLITYFLSIKKLRFIKYLVTFTLLEFIAIVIFHNSLFQIQQALCVIASLLFLILLKLAFKKSRP